MWLTNGCFSFKWKYDFWSGSWTAQQFPFSFNWNEILIVIFTIHVGLAKLRPKYCFVDWSIHNFKTKLTSYTFMHVLFHLFYVKSDVRIDFLPDFCSYRAMASSISIVLTQNRIKFLGKCGNTFPRMQWMITDPHIEEEKSVTVE